VSNGTCTPLTPATFRAMFTAFTDATIYPDATVQVWLDLGAALIDCCSWGSFYQMGQGLWTAHELAKMQMAALQGTGNPSGVSGIVNNKSVGPVSVGYDTQIGIEEGAGQYNLTIYGRQYYHFAQLFGMGPIQVNTVIYPPAGSGPAWPGPWPYPGWFG
jgi:hypothetical protein